MELLFRIGAIEVVMNVPLESFIGVRKKDIWHDFIGVFVKDKKHSSKFTTRIQDNTKEFMNGRLLNSEEIFKHRIHQQTLKVRDMKRVFKEIVKKLIGKP